MFNGASYDAPERKVMGKRPNLYEKPARQFFLADLKTSNNKATKSAALGRWLGGTKVPYI